MPLTGILFNIQRFSIHDGPGIRTTVFFKGCSLRCFWCHNPEGLRPGAEIQFNPDRCIVCGECVNACPEEAHEILNGLHRYDRSLCQVCGTCLNTCYTGALERVGTEYTVEQVLAEVLRDRAFYRESRGGVTLSGGDPLVQHDFALALLQASKREELHTAIETASNCRWDILERLLPYVDLVLMDIKHTDSQKHQRATGVSNIRILENAARLAQSGKPVLFRTPVVPGVNDTAEEIAAIARFIHAISPQTASPANDGLPQLELLPFHKLAAGKYNSLGLEYPSTTLEPPSKEKMQTLVEAARGEGIRVK